MPLLTTASAWLDFLIASGSAKWTAMAPVVVPMLMLLDISPEMTTAAYRVGDTVTNLISPLNPYFVLTLMLKTPGLCGAVFIGGMDGTEEEADLFEVTHGNLPRYAIASTGSAALFLFERALIAGHFRPLRAKSCNRMRRRWLIIQLLIS